MKKIFMFILLGFMCFTLIGCGKDEKKPTEEKQPDDEIEVIDNSSLSTVECVVDDRTITFVLQYGKIYSYSDNKYGEHTEEEIAAENEKFVNIYTNEDAVSWLKQNASDNGYTCDLINETK